MYVVVHLKWFISILFKGDVFHNFRFFDFYVRVAHLAKNGGGPSNEINRVWAHISLEVENQLESRRAFQK